MALHSNMIKTLSMIIALLVIVTVVILIIQSSHNANIKIITMVWNKPL